MEKYLISICLAGVGIVCIFIAGKWQKINGRINLDIFLCFIVGLIFLYFAAMFFKTIPNGLPFELPDGEYKVQPLEYYIEKDQKWILVLVLEKNGKATDGLKPYGKISQHKFGSNNVVIGHPMDVGLHTLTSQQYLVVR